jgi:hypothetical protein
VQAAVPATFYVHSRLIDEGGLLKLVSDLGLTSCLHRLLIGLLDNHSIGQGAFPSLMEVG